MDYESLWKEFSIRMLRASEFGVTKMVNMDDIIKLMGAYEQHFKQLEDEKDKQELSDLGLEPV